MRDHQNVYELDYRFDLDRSLPAQFFEFYEAYLSESESLQEKFKDAVLSAFTHWEGSSRTDAEYLQQLMYLIGYLEKERFVTKFREMLLNSDKLGAMNEGVDATMFIEGLNAWLRLYPSRTEKKIKITIKPKKNNNPQPRNTQTTSHVVQTNYISHTPNPTRVPLRTFTGHANRVNNNS